MTRVLLTALVLLVAISPAFANDGAEGNPGSFGTTNPAAEYCLKLDGISTSADREYWGGAQLGLCRLRDDGLIADWTLYRAAHGSTSQAVEIFALAQWIPMAGPIEDWADQACVDGGGVAVDSMEHLRPGGAVRVCEFPDGSLIEVWTLFGGPGLYPKLARALDLEVSTDAVFWPCPWPRTCMAPCIPDRPPQGLCKFTDGDVKATTFACCCCGSGLNSFAPLPERVTAGKSKKR